MQTALLHSYYNIAEFLLDQPNVDLEALDYYGNNAILLCAKAEQYDLMKKILSIDHRLINSKNDE